MIQASDDPQLTSIVLEDLNSDGDLDIVTLERSANAVAVRLGHGDGTFGQKVFYATGEIPTLLTLADVNADQQRDLVVRVAGGVSSLLGRGDGSFESRIDFDIPADAAPNAAGSWLMAVVDLTGDARVDVIFGYGYSADPCGYADWSRFSVGLGVGDGTFVLGTSWTDRPPVSVTTGDVNSDGFMDLAISYHSADCFVDPGDNSTGLYVSLGDGLGGLQASSTLFSLQGSFEAGSYYLANLRVADLDGDGKTDVTACDGFENWIWAGNGDGTFRPRRSWLPGSPCGDVDLADFDQDGRQDLALGAPGRIQGFLANGDGTFRADAGAVTRCDYAGFAVGDVNRDGGQDFVLHVGGDVEVLLANADGTYGSSRVVEINVSPSSLIVADFDSDDRADVAVVGGRSGIVLPGNGNGTFGAGVEIDTGTQRSSVAAADLDQDGDLDLAVTDAGANTVSIFSGNGDGTFGPGVDFDTGRRPSSVAVADFDRDGDLDLGVSNSESNTVSMLSGNGDGTFVLGPVFPVGRTPVSLVAADLNQDGREDLAVANQGSSTVSILLGTGDGRFQQTITRAVGETPFDIAVGDVDGRGGLDLATPNRHAGSVTILPWDSPRVDVTVGDHPACIAIGDLHAGGAQEVAVGLLGAGVIAVLSTDSGFSAVEKRAAGCDAVDVVIARVNGDARPDFIVANLFSNILSVLLTEADPVAVSVEGFSAAWDGRAVSLRWRLSGVVQTELMGVLVERAEAPSGPFAPLAGAPLDPDDSMQLFDTDVLPERSYWYRLVLLENSGARIPGPVVRIETGRSRLVPTLQVLGNPGTVGALEIRYTIPASPTPSRLVVYDVAGRMVRDFGFQSGNPGAHVLVWDGHSSRGDRVARGIYVVELTAGDTRLSRKAILLRQ